MIKVVNIVSNKKSRLEGKASEIAFWMSKTVQDRISAVEKLRTDNMGGMNVRQGLQRVSRIIKL